MSNRMENNTGIGRHVASLVGGLLVLAALLTAEVRASSTTAGSDSSHAAVSQAAVGSSATRVLFQHGEFSAQLVDLPNDDRFMLEEDAEGRTDYYDIGYRWQGLVVLFLPVHHWSGEWVRYVGPDRVEPGNFADLSANAHEAGMEMPAGGPGFWWRWGGKLGWLGVLGVLVLIRIIRLRRRATSARSLAAHRGPSIGRGDR